MISLHRRSLSLIAALAGGVSGLVACAEPAAPTQVRTLHGAFALSAGLPADPAGLEPVAVEGRQRAWVSFAGPIRPADRAAVEAAGGEILGYLPDHSLVVSAPAEGVVGLRRVAGVQAVALAPTQLKIEPELLSSEAKSAGGQRLVLAVDPGREQAVALAAEAAGLVVLAAVAGEQQVIVEGGVEAAAQVVARADVAWLEAAPRFELHNEWSTGVLQAGQAEPARAPVWDAGIHGEGQIVAVADTGVDQGSCFFPEGKILTYIDEAGGGEVDEAGHGTHVSASAVGDRYGNGRYDRFDGLAPAAGLIAQDIGANLGLTGLPPSLVRLFEGPHRLGARVHSNSWGSPGPGYTSYARNLDQWAHQKGDTVVLSSNGNSGPEAATVGSPATAKNLLSVGAGWNNDRANDMAFFSSRGPTKDGRIKPTLSAPGIWVASAAAGTQCMVVLQAGTSMSCPRVAGAAALVRQYYADGYYPKGYAVAADAFEPSAALVRATLIAGAEAMTGEGAGTFPGNDQGFGRVNLGRSLFLGCGAPATRTFAHDEAVGLATGEDFTASLEIDTQGPLKAALAWTDPPGTLGAAVILVNDLDLELEGPDGTIYKGNHLVEGASAPGGAADVLNVEEIVYLPRAAPGTYTLRVRGKNVPEGPQDFAVVASGQIALPARQGAWWTPVPAEAQPQACADQTLSPAAEATASFRRYASEGPTLGGPMRVGRVWGADYLGLVQVEVPALSAEVDTLSVTLDVTELRDLAEANLIVELIELPLIDAETRFPEVDRAPVLARRVIGLSELSAGALVVALPGATVREGLASLRLSVEGPCEGSMLIGGAAAGAASPTVGLCHVAPPGAGLQLERVPTQHLTEGQLFEHSLKASGGAGPLSYAATGLPAGATLNPDTGVLRWTPSFKQAGRYDLSLSVTDGSAQVTQAAVLRVADQNRAPIFNPIPPASFYFGSAINRPITAVDPDGDLVIVNPVDPPLGSYFDAINFGWKPGVTQVGTHELVFEASDGIDTTQAIFYVEILRHQRPQEPEGCSSASGRLSGLGFALASLLIGGALRRRRGR